MIYDVGEIYLFIYFFSVCHDVRNYVLHLAKSIIPKVCSYMWL